MTTNSKSSSSSRAYRVPDQHYRRCHHSQWRPAKTKQHYISVHFKYWRCRSAQAICLALAVLVHQLRFPALLPHQRKNNDAHSFYGISTENIVKATHNSCKNNFGCSQLNFDNKCEFLFRFFFARSLIISFDESRTNPSLVAAPRATIFLTRWKSHKVSNFGNEKNENAKKWKCVVKRTSLIYLDFSHVPYCRTNEFRCNFMAENFNIYITSIRMNCVYFYWKRNAMLIWLSNANTNPRERHTGPLEKTICVVMRAEETKRCT